MKRHTKVEQFESCSVPVQREIWKLWKAHPYSLYAFRGKHLPEGYAIWCNTGYRAKTEKMIPILSSDEMREIIEEDLKVEFYWKNEDGEYNFYMSGESDILLLRTGKIELVDAYFRFLIHVINENGVV